MFRDYLARRVLMMVPTLLGLSLLIFLLSRVMPGDPILLALGPEARPEQVEQLRREMGLDRPLHVQYLRYLQGVLRGDFGRSLRTHRPVAQDLRDFLPATVELTSVAMLFAILIGVPLGVTAAVRRDGMVDHLSRWVALSGVAMPQFWLAILLQLVFGYYLRQLPLIGRGSIVPARITGLYLVDSLVTGDLAAFWNSLRHLVLPAFTLSLATAAQIMRMTRAGMVGQMRRDYVLAARSYGLPYNLVVYRYMLKNAITSTLTIIGLTYGFLLGNCFVVETVFAWPGIAAYGAHAVIYKDFNAVVAVTLVVGVAYAIVNLAIDVLYGFLDPRVRYAPE